MKFPIISTVVLTLCALAATAQAELKVASVAITSLYAKFHKRFDTENVLQKQLAEIKADIEVRQEKLRKLQEEDKKIRDQYDTSLSDAAVAKLRDQHNAKMNAIKAADQELQDFVQRRQKGFGERRSREMRLLMEEVMAAIKSSAEEGGYDIIVDRGAISPRQEVGIGTPVFPHLKQEFDITPEVLGKLNAGAPEGFDPDAELKRLYGGGTPAAN